MFKDLQSFDCVFLLFVACLAMAEEISLDIAGTDKKKKLEVGSFRIRPDGKQDLKQVELLLYLHDFVFTVFPVF